MNWGSCPKCGVQIAKSAGGEKKDALRPFMRWFWSETPRKSDISSSILYPPASSLPFPLAPSSSSGSQIQPTTQVTRHYKRSA